MELALPSNAIEFDALYGNEEACRDALINFRWPDGFRCPKCRHDTGWTLTTRPVVECARCRHQVSATSGTLFHAAKLSLVKLFKLIYLMMAEKSGTNMSALSRQVGVNYRTAMLWCRKIRQTIAKRPAKKLSGVVEVDETFIGAPSTSKGRKLAKNQAMILILVEDAGGKCGRVRMIPAADAKRDTLEPLVEQNVKGGSHIRTDGHTSYDNLHNRGYTHEKIVTRTKDASRELPHVHRVASLFKRWLNGVLHGAWSHQWLEHTLEEFSFRFNRRNSKHRPHLFNRVIELAEGRPWTREQAAVFASVMRS